MADSSPEDTLLRAKQQLEKLRGSLPKGRIEDQKQWILLTVARMGLQGAILVIDRSISMLASSEIAERVLIYEVLARQCAPLVGQPEGAVYRAILSLCGEPDDGAIAQDLGAVNDDVLSALENVLVDLTVEYVGRPGKECERHIRILHSPDEKGAKVTELGLAVPWDELPPDVREAKMRGTGEDRVPYQLWRRR